MLSVPENVRLLLEKLENAGFESYAVGGCIRDSLRGTRPGDWDLCTAALPEQTHQALAGLPVLDTGLKHGTVTAVVEGERFEITTFRVDGAYTDHRRPENVTFTRSIREDLARRDFTVNAMAFSPKRGLVDPFGGQADLQAGLLRAVGQPEQRLEEDALRILRGLRFASCLGFSVEMQTAAAMREKKELLACIAPERTQVELWKLLSGKNCVSVLREYREIFAVFLPELAPMFDFDQQNPHHIYDVWEHTLHAMEAAGEDPLLRLVMLLHDCAKPLRFTVDFRGDGHFYGHAACGALTARQALCRLRFDSETTDTVCRLIHLHDNDILDSEKSLLRWLKRLGERDLRRLLQIKIADNLAQNPRYYRADRFAAIERSLDALLERQPCFDRSTLALRGGDLKALGLEGKAIGHALDALVEQVIDGAVPNEKAALLAALREYDL